MVDNVVLLNIDFRRSCTAPGKINTHVRYTMSKVTPFGVISASRTVLASEFHARGAVEVDGEMFSDLGEALNREEMNRMLETGANTNFGYNENTG